MLKINLFIGAFKKYMEIAILFVLFLSTAFLPVGDCAIIARLSFGSGSGGRCGAAAAIQLGEIQTAFHYKSAHLTRF
jgi:hypothetical protein